MEHVLDDESRVETTVRLIELGYVDQLTLSHDAGIYSINTPPSWRRRVTPNWRHANIPERIVPMLRQRGVGEQDLHKMLVANPARVLLGRR